MWLMVVLIEGVSFAGYATLRLTASAKGLLLTGLLGGVVSSTATTLVEARRVATNASPPGRSAVVILLANVAMMVRVLAISVVAGPATAPAVAVAIVPGLLLASPSVLAQLRSADSKDSVESASALRQPGQLRAAIFFAILYSAVLIVVAAASDRFGASGGIVAAVISGLADVDAITLSSLDLARRGLAEPHVAATMVAAAVGSNLLVKGGIARVVGGPLLGRRTLLAFVGPLLGLGIGVTLVRLFVRGWGAVG